jgi:hypothetical protein
MKQAAIEYPIQTQIHDCHQANPCFIIVLDIIQVFSYEISHRQDGWFAIAHDIERVGDPESDKIPRTPLPPLRLHRLKIVVRQHQLRIGETRLGLDGQFSRPHFDLFFASHTAVRASLGQQESRIQPATGYARNRGLRGMPGGRTTWGFVEVARRLEIFW